MKKMLTTVFAIFFSVGIATTQTSLDTIITVPGGMFDCFGCATAAFEKTLVVGAPVANNGTGRVYVYTKTDTGWLLEAVLTSTDGNVGDQFGKAVAIYNDLIIVGADGDDENGNNSGAAYIFQNAGGIWIQVAKLKSSDGSGVNNQGDRFGNSVSIYGEYAVVGAKSDWGIAIASGAAYIFKKTGTGWLEKAKLKSPKETGIGDFGESVFISGDYVLVGAPMDNYFVGPYREGAVYVYNKFGENWQLKQSLLPSATDQENRLGYSVSMSGNTIIAGAWFNQETAPNSGAAFIYEKQDSNWVLQAKIKASDAELNDYFGRSVAIKGNFVLVSSDDNTTGALTGATYVFKKEGQNWKEASKLTGGQGSNNFRFGSSVAIGESFFAIGVPMPSIAPGAVYVYSLEKKPIRHFHRLENNQPDFQGLTQLNATNGEDQVYLKVCADGAEASVFSVSKAGQLTGNLILRIKEDTLGAFPERYGVLELDSSNLDSIVYSYKHPDFIPDDLLLSVDYHIQIFDSDAQKILMEVPLKVFRAPVLLVHGLWSDGFAFKKMYNDLISSGLYESKQIYISDYKATNDEAFEVNNWVVPSSIDILIKKLRDEGIAAGKVDLVGHSMGGILGRLYLQSNQYYHDLHKLITLNTPHSGTQSANWLFEQTTPLGAAVCVSQELLMNQSCFDGAVQDLSVNGGAILHDLNGEGKINKNFVPSHVIVTTMPVIQQVSNIAEIFNGVMTVLDIVDNAFYVIPYPLKKVLDITGGLAEFTVSFQKFLDTLYNHEQHDLIVPLSSQLGGLESPQFSLEVNQPHIGSTNNEFVINYVKVLLKTRSDNPVFSVNGFHPDTLYPPIFNFNQSSQEKSISGLPEDSLFVNISSSIEGQTILPGESISIHVSGSPHLTNLVLLMSHSAGKVYRGERSGYLGDFNFTADSTIFGKTRILAAGYDSITDKIVFDSSFVLILPNEDLDSIWIEPNTLTIVQEKQADFQIMGMFENLTAEITNIPDIQHHFVSNRAHLTNEGYISGDSIGMDSMIVVYQNRFCVLPITIIENLFEPLCLNIGQPCDDGNPETVNDIIQTDCSCTGTSSSNPISQDCPSNFTIVLPNGHKEAPVFWGLPSATTICGSGAERPCQPEEIQGFNFLGIFDRSQYFVSTGLKTWETAKIDCELQGGHLAVITSQEENDFIANSIAVDEAAYIGISDGEQEGDFIWVNNEPLTYINWEINEPNNGLGSGEHYVVLHPWTNKWADYNFLVEKKYILERECEDGGLETTQAAGASSGDTLAVGEYNILYNSTDSCGNHKGCSFSIFVLPPNDSTLCSDFVNFALDAVATQSSSNYLFSSADKAIDGNTSGSMWPDFSVAETFWEEKPWFEIDLGEIKNISQINIWPRTDCCSEHLNNFYLIISESPFNSGNLDSILLQSDAHVFFQKGQVAKPTIWAVGVSGRFVRIQMDKESFLALAEVEVLGCEQSTNRQSSLKFNNSEKQSNNQWHISSRSSHDSLILRPNEENGNFILLPNPSNGRTSVVFSTKIAEAFGSKLLITDILGKRHHQFRLEHEDMKHPYSLPIGDLRSGLYIIRVYPDGLNPIAKQLIIINE